MKENKTIYEHLVDELKCSFCLTTLEAPMITTCSHLFCMKCLTDHLNQKSHNSCPICKAFITMETTQQAPTQINNILIKLKQVERDRNHPFHKIKKEFKGVKTVDLTAEKKKRADNRNKTTNHRVLRSQMVDNANLQAPQSSGPIRNGRLDNVVNLQAPQSSGLIRNGRLDNVVNLQTPQSSGLIRNGQPGQASIELSLSPIQDNLRNLANVTANAQIIINRIPLYSSGVNNSGSNVDSQSPHARSNSKNRSVNPQLSYSINRSNVNVNQISVSLQTPQTSHLANKSVNRSSTASNLPSTSVSFINNKSPIGTSSINTPSTSTGSASRKRSNQTADDINTPSLPSLSNSVKRLRTSTPVLSARVSTSKRSNGLPSTNKATSTISISSNTNVSNVTVASTSSTSQASTNSVQSLSNRVLDLFTNAISNVSIAISKPAKK